MQMLISRKTVGPFIDQKDPLCAWCGGPKDPLKVVINGSPENTHVFPAFQEFFQNRIGDCDNIVFAITSVCMYLF